MIKFSVKNKAPYDLSLNYPELPEDLVEITAEKHQELLTALNSGCIVFDDLTYSDPSPSRFHEWDGTAWVDNRAAEEIVEYERSLLPKLSKRQFLLYLFDNKMYDQVMGEINANPRFKIEFDTVADIERLSPTVLSMAAALSLTDEQVDEMWRQALTL